MSVAMAELGKQTVEFSALVVRAAEESFISLKQLVDNAKSTKLSDTDKKVGLLKFVVKTQQRMLRLNALAEWCKQVPLINYCQELGSTLSSHDICFTQAADSLFFMHEGLQQARAPLYDVPSAIEVLLTGSYQHLPKCLDDVGMRTSLDEQQQKPALRKLEVLVRSKLLEMTLPREITEVKVSKGTVTLSVEGEFKVLVTLGYRGDLSMWRILHLDLLVGERSGPIKLEVTRKHFIGDDLERRMSVAQNPFAMLYAVLHELCVAIVMDTVIRQVRSLLQGRWKDAICFDLVLDSGNIPANQEGEADSVNLRTPGLKLMYWLDSDKNSCPFIKIEPGSDLQIRCFHSTFVVDPITGKEAEFALNQSCIDVEKLLLKAIRCNRYTRLLEIQKELLRNAHVCQASSDVILQSLLDVPGVEGGNMLDSKKRVGPEVLCVRAYGSSFISLGINMRSGRFLLQSSKSTLTPSVLNEYEDALTQGSISVADAFINLRIKSILHILAAIGKFLGLEVCDHGFGINKVSKGLLDGSNVLALGFPGCESSHFLLVEFEKDFTPSFKLVETQVDGLGKPRSFNDLGNALRVKEIDIEQIRILEDDLNLITSDMARFVSSFSEPEGLNQASVRHHPELVDEALAEVSGSQVSFSSIVDELFGLQEGTSALVSSDANVSVPENLPADNCPGKDQKCRKQSASDLVRLIPSLQGVECIASPNKRRKTYDELVESELVRSRSPSSPTLSAAVATSTKTIECNFGSIISEAIKGNAPSSVLVYALLHLIRHSSLSIKHAKLTRQMEALDIEYVERTGLRDAISDIWFRFPFAQNDSWQNICLHLGRPGSMCWDVKLNDQYFRDLQELQKGSKTTPWGSGVLIANSSDVNSHIRYDPQGVVLSYQSVEADSIKKLVADLQRLSNARMFALVMQKLLGIKPDEGSANPAIKVPTGGKGSGEPVDKWRAFKIEAVGLTSLCFSFGSGVLARFVVEWESGRDGCTMHVSPDQLWPHTKFLEDFINGAKIESLLDCIRLTIGPLHVLVAATRPARASTASGIPLVPVTASSKQSNQIHQTQGIISPSTLPSPDVVGQSTSATSINTVASPASSPFGGSFHGIVGRSGPGIVPSFLLPTDVAVVLHGPYWIRIFYRKRFAVDMRCSVGDQVWLQPAAPPKDGASTGGSLPCPLFKPFIMEHVAHELKGLESSLTGSQGETNQNSSNTTGSGGNRGNFSVSSAMSRSAMRRVVSASASLVAGSAIIGLGDDGGYGGGWVPLVALKRVLRGIFKYLGVLWLFSQLPDLVREILGSILKDNEGAIVNLDPEQPVLRFFIRGYSFLVSVYRFQLLLQIRSIRRPQQQQQQQNGSSAASQEELTQFEIQEICDYFSHRVASEPYDASRVASFITLLTLPISALREFLKLIAWKKAGEIAPSQRLRIELCLENHSGTDSDSSCAATKSNIHYDRPHNTVEFTLIIVLDPEHIPQTYAAGGAAWLPYCVSVRLRYTFGDNPGVTFLRMEGSHGGRACWQQVDNWEKCKQRVSHTVEVDGSSAEDLAQGRLKSVADSVQTTLQLCLQGLREG